MYTSIFFDLDDTLWDTQGNARECLQEIFADFDIGRFYPTFDDFFKVYMEGTEIYWGMYGRGEIDKPTLISKRFLYPFRQFAEVKEETTRQMSDELFRRIRTKTRLINGAIDLLDYLAPKYRLHIISNGFTEQLSTKVDKAGMGNYFEHILLSETIGVNKPDPAIYRHLLNMAGATPGEVIMVGDNITTDILGAKNSGIDQIWLNEKGMDNGGLIPTHTVSKLSEIKGIL